MKALINGLSMHYELAGPTNGKPVVFIHGFPFSRAMWGPQVEWLSGEYQILAYDVRGHGESDTGDGQYLIEFFVDDLFNLLDHCGIRKAVVCGLSMGGYIALRAIERNPERFAGLVLADTRSDADTNEGKLKRAASIRTLTAEGVKVFADGFLKAVFASESFQNKPETVTFIRGIIEKTSPTAIVGTLIALAGRTDTTPSLERIQVPTLIIVGEHDTLTPPSAAEAMKKKIPNSELVVVRSAAHMSNLENHEAFNHAL
ncbi:MAG TPA: alpha/beta fold hydrolase, partial [Bacteroidota bacterium]